MTQKHYVVTGGAGFIGSHVISSLLDDERAHVTCLDDFDAFYPREIKRANIGAFLSSARFSLLEMDLDVASPGALAAAIPEPVDAIIHLAAKAGVRPSIQQPHAYIQTNINGTQVMLDFAVLKKVQRFVFASSSSIYGVNKQVPWREDAQPLPISPYAMTKLAGEAAGHVYSRLYGLSFIALRLFTVYGPGQRPDLAIHRFTKAIEQGKPITIFGDGSTCRDYTFIDDIVKGIIAALHFETRFDVFNLGNHQTVSLQDLILSLEHITGKKALLEAYPDQPGDVPYTCAAIAKAQRLLHYRPETALEQGLQRFYEWFHQHEEILLTY